MELRDETRERFVAPLRAALAAINVPVSPEQVELMFRHYQFVIETNRQFNLTRITTPEDASIKHYADSLSVLSEGVLRGMELNASAAKDVLDVGTGAGFPAVPLAIARPNWRILAIDGTGKKARFVAQCARELGLIDLAAQHIRAETLAGESPGAFDLVLLRAVGEMAEVLQHTSALPRRGGFILFYKTARIAQDEVEAALRVAAANRLEPLPPVSMQIPAQPDALERRFYGFRRK